MSSSTSTLGILHTIVVIGTMHNSDCCARPALLANVLYLESPAGVGFSYSSNTSFYTLVTDEITARDNLIFLQRWFTEFPEYSKNDIFITGESYAGHYAPQLAQLIVQTKTNFNLNGIGNPLMEFDTDLNSKAEFFWSHGLISDSTYNLFTRVCNYFTIRRQTIQGNLSDVCAKINGLVFTKVSNYIDQYDVTLDVCLSSANQQAYVLNQMVCVVVGVQESDCCEHSNSRLAYFKWKLELNCSPQMLMIKPSMWNKSECTPHESREPSGHDQETNDKADTKKQFSELLMKAASDCGALTASVANFQIIFPSVEFLIGSHLVPRSATGVFPSRLCLISCPPEMKNGGIDPNHKSDSNWGFYNKCLLLKFTIFISEI
ncbi:hypothetical protein JHK85_040817 [Glycine max]|nr:hypothetical protein JHK86_040234 [Glycine max]KAG4965842.1 hypothetical protein JHK85_040817 [Glycine max]